MDEEKQHRKMIRLLAGDKERQT